VFSLQTANGWGSLTPLPSRHVRAKKFSIQFGESIVRFHQKSLARGIALASVAATLTACGGGGGGGGSGGLPGGGPISANEYEISLRADREALPINVAGVLPGTGVYAPYSTTVYVSARRNNTSDPIPGGDDVFACNLIPQGLEVGALYYLDGDEDHEDDDGNPLPFRAVALDSNAGGASFHFHAGATAGTATITCAVTDPQSGKQVSTAFNISVGRVTGKASQVTVNVAPGYVFAQGKGGATQAQLQVEVLDDLGQTVPDPISSNLLAEIDALSGAAGVGAKLRGTGADGERVAVKSINGLAQFSLISGLNAGTIVVKITADRSDNDVENGVSQPISNLVSVPVLTQTPAEPLLITDEGSLPQAKKDNDYAAILNASGGIPPYSWPPELATPLPPGLSLSATGILTGKATTAGTFSFVAVVKDSSAAVQTVKKRYEIVVQ
jgi:hypothetical protein